MAGVSILRYILDNAPTAKVRACCHNTGPIIQHEQIEYIRGDLRSVDDCRRMAKGCDSAIMAAAYTGGADFVRTFPWEHMNENLAMNIKMLDAFRSEKVKRIIFIGSATLYQEFKGRVREDELDLKKDPHEVYFCYGWAMRFIEKMCGFLRRQHGTEIIMVRLGNIFGPYAKFHPKYSNFIPAIVRKAVDRMDPFEVWGSPDVARDVLYSDDFARAIVMMADNDRIKFETFNLGSGLQTKVSNVVEWALKYAGHNPAKIKYIQDKPTTMKFRVLDCTKINRILGWYPKYTIEDGIKKTTQWWIENKHSWKK